MYQQTYATLGRTNQSVTRISPLSPSQQQPPVVTRATFSDYRPGPEIVTTSNRIQESCI